MEDTTQKFHGLFFFWVGIDYFEEKKKIDYTSQIIFAKQKLLTFPLSSHLKAFVSASQT